ncbi:MAG: AMMECR1 domain-containing protein [Thermostichus sp. DG_1_6_bins_120]
MGGLCVVLGSLLGLGLPTGSPPGKIKEAVPLASSSPPGLEGIPPSLPDTLPALARQAIAYYFATGQVLPTPEGIPPQWRRSAGVFVTVSRNRQPRGCWGSLQPSADNLATATIRAAVGAVSRDGRYLPLRATELETASIQVALVRRVVPIASVQDIDPTRTGLFIRSGTQGAVLLPGEALTSEWQLATARRWAGIPAGQPVELFRVEAELLHEF